MPSFLFIQSPFEARRSFLNQWRKPSYMCLLGLCAKSSEPPCLKGAVQIGMPCNAPCCATDFIKEKRGCAMQTSLFLVIELKANKLLSHFLVFTAYVINQHIKKQISVQKMMRISSQINHKVLRKQSMMYCLCKYYGSSCGTVRVRAHVCATLHISWWCCAASLWRKTKGIKQTLFH